MSYSILRLLGTVALGFVGFQLCRKVLTWIYANIIGPKLLGSSINLRQMGGWAVVTGSTDGIGKAYARELARRGLNLVLISRSLNKLQAVSKEISEEFNVEVRIIDIDFTQGLEIYEKVRTNIEGLDIGVLVNNVGMSYAHPEYFLDWYKNDPKGLCALIAANVHSVTHMCALIMPGMVVKRKGIIINLSSLAAVIPNPLLSVYSGTKAFVKKFSDDLQTEYKDFGIIVQSIEPGYVATNMSKIRKTSLFAPSPETYVKSALSTIGISTHTSGYLPHALLQLVLDLAANLFGERFAKNLVFKNILATRNRALRRAAKEQ